MKTAFLATIVLAGALTAPLRAQSPIESGESGESGESALGVETFEAAWSIINEQHFDPEFNGVDWEAVRTNLLPRVRAAADTDETRKLIREMLSTLDQSHFSLIPREALEGGENAGAASPAGTVGFDVRLRGGVLLVNRVEPGSAANAAGVHAGWILDAIDGRTTADMRADFPPSSTLRIESVDRKGMLPRIDGEVGSHAEYRFLDGDGETHEFDLERRERDAVPFDLPGLPTFYLTSRTERIEHDGYVVGVVHFSNWFRGISKAIDAALFSLRDCDGIVIDLRGNSGGDGSMAGEVAGHFFDEPGVLGIQRMRRGDSKYRYTPRRRSRGKKVGTFDGPLAIVTDETTGSCSEVFTGGMQSLGRAVVIGEVTAGAVLPALLTELPNRDYLLHAIGVFLTAEGHSLEGSGVKPDIVVTLDRASLLAGKDVLMDAAVKYLAESP